MDRLTVLGILIGVDGVFTWALKVTHASWSNMTWWQIALIGVWLAINICLIFGKKQT